MLDVEQDHIIRIIVAKIWYSLNDQMQFDK